MTIPRENALAFFPSSVTAGNVVLRPLTLGGAVRLAEIGVDLGRRVPKDKLFQTAWVLAKKWKIENGELGMMESTPSFCIFHSQFSIFCRRAKVGLKELQNAVEKVLNDAFQTYIKPAASGGTVHLTPHGIGWPLEYAEFLCSEYGWSWQTAIDTPLATVYALYAAYRQRNGGKHGFDYIERANMKKN